MANYRVEFAREWLLGRWGNVDRVFSAMGGKASDPSGLQHAWIVPYKGKPQDLGRLLTHALNIQRGDFQQWGVLFEIQSLTEPVAKNPGLVEVNPRQEEPETVSAAPEAPKPQANPTVQTRAAQPSGTAEKPAAKPRTYRGPRLGAANLPVTPPAEAPNANDTATKSAAATETTTQENATPHKTFATPQEPFTVVDSLLAKIDRRQSELQQTTHQSNTLRQEARQAQQSIISRARQAQQQQEVEREALAPKGALTRRIATRMEEISASWEQTSAEGTPAAGKRRQQQPPA